MAKDFIVEVFEAVTGKTFAGFTADRAQYDAQIDEFYRLVELYKKNAEGRHFGYALDTVWKHFYRDNAPYIHNMREPKVLERFLPLVRWAGDNLKFADHEKCAILLQEPLRHVRTRERFRIAEKSTATRATPEKRTAREMRQSRAMALKMPPTYLRLSKPARQAALEKWNRRRQASTPDPVVRPEKAELG